MRLTRIGVALVAAFVVGFAFLFVGKTSQDVNEEAWQREALQEAVEVVRSYLQHVEQDRIADAINTFMAPRTREVYLEQYNLLTENSPNEILLSKRVRIDNLDVVQTMFDDGYVVVRAVYEINARYLSRNFQAKRVENYIVGYYPTEGWKIASIEDFCLISPDLCR